MKRLFLNIGLIVLLLWGCGSSVCAEGPPLPAAESRPKYDATLEEAVAYLQNEGIIDGETLSQANPDAPICFTQVAAIFYRWCRSQGVPEPLPGQPFAPIEINPSLYYYKPLCLLAQLDLLDEAGWACNIKETDITKEMVDGFLQKTFSNAEVVTLLYGFERVRLGQFQKSKIPEELLKTLPYPDVNWNDPYLEALIWAKYHELITGILDESSGNAVTFNPEKAEIGNGICARGQFFVVLYLYVRYVEAEQAEAAPGAENVAPPVA